MNELSTASPEEHPPAAADEESAREATPDEAFVLRLRKTLETFTYRQSEILRLSEFMTERAAEIDSATTKAKQLIERQLGDPDQNAIERLVELFKAFENDDLGGSDLTESDRDEAISTAIREVSETLPDAHLAPYIMAAARAVNSPPGVDLLRSTLLVLLIGELEMLINFVARACYERQPDALDDAGKTLTWAEIAKHDSIADLRDSVVDRTIEDVLRGSLSDWIDHFVKRFKISDIEIARGYDAQEAVQRRHCIVHNASQASNLYLEKLRTFKPKVSVGDELVVDAEYLRTAADTVFLIGYALVWSLGHKLCKDAEWLENLQDFLTNRSYVLLQERRYSTLQMMGKSAPYQRLPELDRFIFQVNVWLAYKLDGRFDEVRGEVEAFDVAAKSRRLALAKLALLDRDDEAYRLAQSMLRDEELKPHELVTWPLLAGVRAYARDSPEGYEGAGDLSPFHFDE